MNTSRGVEVHGPSYNCRCTGPMGPLWRLERSERVTIAAQLLELKYPRPLPPLHKYLGAGVEVPNNNHHCD